jgi:DNA uptake protein ComE-like DNA-binding protein
MKIEWKEFFYFNKTERNGIFLLLSLWILIILLSKFLPYLFKKPQTNFESFKKEIELFEKELEIERQADRKKDKTVATKLFFFDPNTASQQDFIELGLELPIAKRIIKYRNTGAKFKKKADFKKIYKLKEEDYDRLAPYIQIESIKYSPKPIKKGQTLKPFVFNPNTVTQQDLLQLGLSDRVAQNLLKYRERGGRFDKKTDLKIVYGLTEKEYTILEPFIEIPAIEIADKPDIKTIKNIPKAYDANIKLDVNKADIQAWKQLKGIGDVYANRIVQFRTKLGGFTSIEQINSTYGLPDSLIQNLQHQLMISPIFRQLAINLITYDSLKLHPYIKPRQAQSIINFRINHGAYKSLADLKNVRSLSPDFIEKIAPYLSFEE